MNHKNSNHCDNKNLANTLLAVQMQSKTLAGSPEV